MIVKKMTIGDKEFDYVHSDGQFLLKRDDGLLLACDLHQGEHTYTETDMVIGEVQDYETAAKILLGMEV